MVVKDIEREDIEHVCKSLGCSPIASLDHFTPDKLADAGLVEEGDYLYFLHQLFVYIFFHYFHEIFIYILVPAGTSKVVKITGIAKPGHTVSILMR